MAWFQKRGTDQAPDKRPGIIQEQLDRHLSGHLSGVVKFDCPHCKHQTLAFAAKWPVIDSPFSLGFVGQEMRYTCIVCGKTFRKGEPAYEEVEGNDAH